MKTHRGLAQFAEMKKRRKCYWCGCSSSGGKGDHLPMKFMFTGLHLQNWIPHFTACKKCNLEFSVDDDEMVTYLRLTADAMMSTQADGMYEPVRQLLFGDPGRIITLNDYGQANNNGNRRLREAVMSSMINVQIVTPNGILLREGGGFSLKAIMPTIERLGRRLAKALWMLKMGSYMPPHVEKHIVVRYNQVGMKKGEEAFAVALELIKTFGSVPEERRFMHSITSRSSIAAGFLEENGQLGGFVAFYYYGHLILSMFTSNPNEV